MMIVKNFCRLLYKCTYIFIPTKACKLNNDYPFMLNNIFAFNKCKANIKMSFLLAWRLKKM